MTGKRWWHWIADAAAVAGGTLLALIKVGTIVVAPLPLTAIAVGTGLALKLSRSPVRSKPVDGKGAGGEP